MAKKSKLGMALNAARAARVSTEDAARELLGSKPYAYPPIPELAMFNARLAAAYSHLMEVEIGLTNMVETESEGVTKPESEKETHTESEKSDTVAESSDLKAGLGEKPEPVAPAPASEEKSVAPAAEEKAPEVKKASEVVDEDAEKAERTRICGSLFRVLKGSMDGKTARVKTEEIRDAFLGKPTRVEDITHDQHEAFMAHMETAIADASKDN